MKVALEETFAEILSPSQKMSLIIRPKVSESHVSYKSNAKIEALGMRGLIEIITTDPFRIHDPNNFGFSFGF